MQGDEYHLASANNASADYIKYLSENPIKCDRGTLVGRAALERRTVHIPDCLADPEYTGSEYARVGKHRSLLGVPLLRDGVAVGVIGLLRSAVRPYTDKQIELVTTFADQAMIAIENVRLFDEVQARTRDLSEALEQQTATSEVLKVISSSPGELEPVFQSMLANAVHICDAVALCFDTMAKLSVPPGSSASRLNMLRFSTNAAHFDQRPEVASIACCSQRRVVRIADDAAESTLGRRTRKIRWYSLAHCVPLLKDNELIGAITILSPRGAPFTDKQVELVQNFASQAVIAIENARLLMNCGNARTI